MKNQSAAPEARPAFSIEDVYPVSDAGNVIATMTVRFETPAGPLRVHGWRVVEMRGGPRHISVPVERVPVERKDGTIGRVYYPIVTYPKAWGPELLAACIEAFNRHSIEGGATCR
jgi:hypothetical protein